MKLLLHIAMFLVSCLITGAFLVCGVPYNFGKSILESFQLKFWKGVFNFLKYWLVLVFQIFIAVVYLIVSTIRVLYDAIATVLFNLSYFQDLIWNATGGELMEDIITHEEKTLFGKGSNTISGATGQIEFKRILNKTGQKFSNVLNKVFREVAHCVDAYKAERDRGKGALNLIKYFWGVGHRK